MNRAPCLRLARRPPALDLIAATRLRAGKAPVALPVGSLFGALVHHICTADAAHFQPMNANFGLLPSIQGLGQASKKERREARAPECLAALEEFLVEHPDIM